MKQAKLKVMPELAPHICPRCGGPMRLIGIERHPAEARTDLLTYCCTSCDEFLVLPIENQANSFRVIESMNRFLDEAFRSQVSTQSLSPLKADNSHVTPIMCENCRGRAHLTDCAPCTISVGIREIWTFKCEICGEDVKRAVEK